jgi:hypothetical protein
MHSYLCLKVTYVNVSCTIYNCTTLKTIFGMMYTPATINHVVDYVCHVLCADLFFAYIWQENHTAQKRRKLYILWILRLNLTCSGLCKELSTSLSKTDSHKYNFVYANKDLMCHRILGQPSTGSALHEQFYEAQWSGIISIQDFLQPSEQTHHWHTLHTVPYMQVLSCSGASYLPLALSQI